MNATIHIEDLSETKKKITFEVPENRIQDLIDSEYRDLKKKRTNQRIQEREGTLKYFAQLFQE